MRSIILLGFICLPAFLASCGDDSGGQSLEDCQNFCLRVKECDEAGVVNDETVNVCLDLCDQASEGTVEYEIKTSTARCSRYTDCNDFNDCVNKN